MNTSMNQSSNKTLTYMLYVLYILAIASAGILALIALIINYVKLNSVKGTIYESHFRWQIRTFWWYLTWTVLAFLPFIFLFFTGENIDLFASVAVSSTIFCGAVLFVSWVWIVYRAIRGILALNENQALPL